MAKLIRNGPFVELVQPGFTVRCSVPYGAAPLEMINTKNPAAPIMVTNSPAGEGFQIVADTGQDLTQSSPNGLDGNQFYPLNGLYTLGSSYFGTEEAFVGDRDGREALYQVSGKGPYFWASLDKEDDCVPPDPRGEHGWSTKYHDVMGLGSDAYHANGTPIYFKFTPRVPSGILLIGDAIRNYYHTTTVWPDNDPCEITGGCVAGQINISLLHADGSTIAAVWFGLEAYINPAYTINDIYNAPHTSITINKQGGAAFHTRGKAISIPGNYSADINSEEGLLIDWRYIDGNVEIRMGGFLAAVIKQETNGLYAGLFASGGAGHVKFHRRKFYDAGLEFTQSLRTTKRNTLIVDYSVYRVLPPYNFAAYRLNMPVAFIAPPLREWVRHYNSYGEPQNIGEFIEMRVGETVYAGRADGSAGLHAKLLSWTSLPGRKGHVGATPACIAFNPLSHNANYIPEVMYRHNVVTEWAPRFKADL